MNRLLTEGAPVGTSIGASVGASVGVRVTNGNGFVGSLLGVWVGQLVVRAQRIYDHSGG
jgi:hypothetical protein